MTKTAARKQAHAESHLNRYLVSGYRVCTTTDGRYWHEGPCLSFHRARLALAQWRRDRIAELLTTPEL